MTKLNLSGSQPNNSQQKPVTQHEDESIKNQTVGALGALAMFAAVIVIGSCSHSSKPVAAQPSVQPTAPVSAPAVTTPTTVPAPVVAKATKKHRAATLSYVNREYGLSFNFPRNYQLKTQLKAATGHDTQAASATTESLPMNFVQSGGLALAAVELPGNSYPGTDFNSGFVNVSVNPGMTAEACAQFAFPEESAGSDASSQVKAIPAKIGAIEFQEVENPGSATTKQAEAKYYHVFGNGACYEFALGIGTASDGNAEEITPVDRKEVFGKLEKILATVKLQPAVMPETQMTQAHTPAPAANASPAEASGTPENTSAHTPKQNPEPNQEKSASVPNF